MKTDTDELIVLGLIWFIGLLIMIGGVRNPMGLSGFGYLIGTPVLLGSGVGTILTGVMLLAKESTTK
jgi:hypothetical protein